MSKKQEFRNTNLRLFAWTFTWVGTLAFATIGPKLLWTEADKLYSVLAIVINVLIGIGMLYVNRELVTKMDELQRKIHLEAMAITLGLTVVVGVAFSTLDIVNLIPGDAEISGLIAFIGLCYFANIVIGNWRYR